MPTSSAVVHALTACAAVTMFAGCSAGNPHVAAPPLVPLDGAASQSIQQQGLPTGRRKDDLLGSGGTKLLAQSATRSFFDPAATGRPLILAGDYNKSVINIYSQAKGNAMVGQIVGAIYGPIGLATDTSGDVYIANEVSATVSVFAPPYTKRPKLTLDDVGNTAYDVAVSTQGLVAVANFNGSVNIYRKNSTEPCVTVSDPSFGGVLHDVFDDQGNLYIDGGHVGVIRGGCRATTIEMLSTGNVIGLIAGIKVDNHDRIAIEDAKNLAIYAYDPPKNGSLGNPVTTTPLTGSSGPFNFAFTASGRELYISDYLNGNIEEYAYPTGGTPEDTISAGVIGGVAVTPPLIP